MQINVLCLTLSYSTSCCFISFNSVKERVSRQENGGIRWVLFLKTSQHSCAFYLGQSVVGRGSRGTGEVASIRAGFRMIGRDIGGTPTCSGEARGCRISGD